MSEETHFNLLELRAQQTGLGAPYLSLEDAKRALAMKRNGTKIKYIAVHFNVTDTTIRRYIRQAEDAEQQPATAATAATTIKPTIHRYTKEQEQAWAKLPPEGPSKFTQADVDFCCQPQINLTNLAYEATILNPTLIFPDTTLQTDLDPRLEAWTTLLYYTAKISNPKDSKHRMQRLLEDNQ